MYYCTSGAFPNCVRTWGRADKPLAPGGICNACRREPRVAAPARAPDVTEGGPTGQVVGEFVHLLGEVGDDLFGFE